MLKTLKTVVLAAVAFGAVSAMADDVVTKEGTGQAAIGARSTDKNYEPAKLAAFEEAKKAALRNAVEQAAGVFVQADTLTRNSQLVIDQVYANATGYVKSFDVVSKSEEKNVVTVTVKAQVGTAQLDKDIQAVRGMLGRLKRTKLIVILNEQSVDEKGISTKSESLATALTTVFKRDGWQIIDEKSAGGGLKLASGTAMGVPEAKELGQKNDADYILYGSVALRYQVERDSDPIKGLFLVTGEYDLAMFETQTGRQLAKVSGKFDQELMRKLKISPLKSYSSTAQDLCNGDSARISGELRNPVIEYLRNQDINGASVVVKVSGLKSYKEVSEFEKSVATLANVKGVSSNGDYEKGTQLYEVTFQGNAQALGDALETSTFKKKKITVSAVKNNKVEVEIAK